MESVQWWWSGIGAEKDERASREEIQDKCIGLGEALSVHFVKPWLLALKRSERTLINWIVYLSTLSDCSLRIQPSSTSSYRRVRLASNVFDSLRRSGWRDWKWCKIWELEYWLELIVIGKLEVPTWVDVSSWIAISETQADEIDF